MADTDVLPPSAALSLTLAIVAASTAPLVLLDGKLEVVAASDSFVQAFDLEMSRTTGRSLFEIGCGEWDVPQLRALLATTVSGQVQVDAYEFDLNQPGGKVRRVVLNPHKLVYETPGEVRLLLSVTDITDARIAAKVKDDLIREKGVLLQEIQHRVANSLQIIAAILMQSARKVNSDETRLHLKDAHQRVMSIASVQRQLAATGGAEIHLNSYFTQLCESLGASMIRDHNQIKLSVKVDESSVGADVSVSLGLIVTELVINALKHAFPNDRAGTIKVDYQTRGPNWTLSVADDGVGMQTAPTPAKGGLGTSIVDSQAKQLHAHVNVADNHPGTKVSLVHAKIAAVGEFREVPAA